MAISQSLSNYVIIKGEYVSHLQPLTTEEAKQFQERQGSASRKLFLELQEVVPLLNYVRFRLRVPGQIGMYLCLGVVTRVQDLKMQGALNGIGVDLFEMQRSNDSDSEIDSPNAPPAAPKTIPGSSTAGAKVAAKPEKASPAKQSPAKSINGGRISFVIADAADAGAKETTAGAEAAAVNTIPLPRSDAVVESIKGLLQKELTVSHECVPLELAAPHTVVLGVYVSKDDVPRAFFACDLKFACHAAGALTMLPEDVVKKALSDKLLSSELLENIQEIMNISANLFNNPSTPHLKLKTVIPLLTAPCPEDIKLLLLNPRGRLDMEIVIPGFD